MTTVIELINEMRKRPALYIGQNSLSLFRAYIDGWASREPVLFGNDDFLNEFQDWVEKKFNLKTTQSWNGIILSYSSDEADALKNFFEYFDQWILERNKRIKKQK